MSNTQHAEHRKGKKERQEAAVLRAGQGRQECCGKTTYRLLLLIPGCILGRDLLHQRSLRHQRSTPPRRPRRGSLCPSSCGGCRRASPYLCCQATCPCEGSFRRHFRKSLRSLRQLFRRYDTFPAPPPLLPRILFPPFLSCALKAQAPRRFDLTSDFEISALHASSKILSRAGP